MLGWALIALCVVLARPSPDEMTDTETKIDALDQFFARNPTPEQMVRFAIFCAAQFPQQGRWEMWANRWLSGEDRSEKAAFTAYLLHFTSGVRTQIIANEAAYAAWCFADANADDDRYIAIQSAARSAAELAQRADDINFRRLVELARRG